MITNPENLSKDRLKAELKRRGIDFSSQENKKYYVDLYRKKVMTATVESLRSEFSDDDVTSSPGLKRKGPRGRKSKKESQIAFIKNLQDDELMDELTDFGEDPGPITPLTRGVYERKLAKLMELEGTPRKRPLPPKEAEPAANESFIGEWSDEDEDENENDEVDEAPAGRSYNLRRRDTPSEDSLDKRPPRRQSPAKSKAPPSQTMSPTGQRSRASRTSRRPDNSDMCRTLWSFFLLVMVFLVVFLLYEHVTVPQGKTSLLTSGCDGLHSAILSVVGPLMERQEVEPEGSGSAEPPPEEIKPDDPPPEEKKPDDPPTPPPDQKPVETPPPATEEKPKSDPPKDTTDKPKTDKPKTAPKPKPASDKPKPTSDKPKKTDAPPPTEKPAPSEPPSNKPHPTEKPPKPNPKT